MNNVETVRAMYASYRKGDMPGVMERIAEDIEWEYAYPDRGIPWLAPRRGRASVQAFFHVLADELTFAKFEVNAVFGEGNLVVALISMEAVVKSTGRSISELDDAHLWHFDNRGCAKRFRHLSDTLQHALALGIAQVLPHIDR